MVERYFDDRPWSIETRVSTEMTPAEKADALARLTHPKEDWGRGLENRLMIYEQPDDLWKFACQLGPLGEKAEMW